MPDITPKEESPGEEYIRNITINLVLATPNTYAVRCPEWKYASWKSPEKLEETVAQIVRGILAHNNEVTRLKEEEKESNGA